MTSLHSFFRNRGSPEAKKLTKQYYTVNSTAASWVGQVIGAARERAGTAGDCDSYGGDRVCVDGECQHTILGTDLINSFGFDADLKVSVDEQQLPTGPPSTCECAQALE